MLSAFPQLCMESEGLGSFSGSKCFTACTIFPAVTSFLDPVIQRIIIAEGGRGGGSSGRVTAENDALLANPAPASFKGIYCSHAKGSEGSPCHSKDRSLCDCSPVGMGTDHLKRTCIPVCLPVGSQGLNHQWTEL